MTTEAYIKPGEDEVEALAREEAYRRMEALLKVAGASSDIKAWWPEGFVMGALWWSQREGTIAKPDVWRP